MSGVEQQDREAAAKVLRGQSLLTKMEVTGMIEGHWDDDDFVQAFARHRHEARKAALVEAAGIADKFAYRHELDIASGLKGRREREHHLAACRGIATAIRSAIGGE